MLSYPFKVPPKAKYGAIIVLGSHFSLVLVTVSQVILQLSRMCFIFTFYYYIYDLH